MTTNTINAILDDIQKLKALKASLKEIQTECMQDDLYNLRINNLNIFTRSLDEILADLTARIQEETLFLATRIEQIK